MCDLKCRQSHIVYFVFLSIVLIRNTRILLFMQKIFLNFENQSLFCRNLA